MNSRYEIRLTGCAREKRELALSLTHIVSRPEPTFEPGGPTVALDGGMGAGDAARRLGPGPTGRDPRAIETGMPC